MLCPLLFAIALSFLLLSSFFSSFRTLGPMHFFSSLSLRSLPSVILFNFSSFGILKFSDVVLLPFHPSFLQVSLVVMIMTDVPSHFVAILFMTDFMLQLFTTIVVRLWIYENNVKLLVVMPLFFVPYFLRLVACLMSISKITTTCLTNSMLVRFSWGVVLGVFRTSK